MEKIYKSNNIFVRNLTLIVAFAVPLICFIFMYIGRGIFPFGDEMYLRSDMYHQYTTFLKEFQSILKNGDSLLYTWNIGLGSDFPGTYAYYLATPLYWLMAILPTEYIPEIMSGFIVLKAGLMSATFAYYVQEHTRRRNMMAAAFGIFYAFSSYMAAYSWNLMWLDCLVLLPLIALGLERLVQKKRVILYTVSLAVAILSNYYIAIMICIFLVIYFIYLVICEPGRGRIGGWKNLLRTVGRFALYSVLAGLMAAATVIPAFATLSGTASGDFNFPTKLTFYFNVLEMISHAVMNVEPTVLSGYIPNIYCTIGLFMIIPLFLLCRKIKLGVKIGKVILMLIFLFSFSLNIPTYIWHGFHFPNSLSSRQSFIYIFLVLAIAYEVVLKIRSFNVIEITACFVAGVIAIYGLQALYASEDYTVMTVTISALFLALYYIWMMVVKSKRVSSVILVIALLVISIAEAMVNTNVTGYKTTGRSAYMADNADYTALLESIDDDGFYRVEKVTRRTKNDGAWLNYRSASEFSSTTSAGISDFYNDMGMQGSTNSFSYYGHTPLTTAILGVKYELSGTELDDELMTLVGESNGYYLYQNKYSLSLGFMADQDLMNVNLSADNAFDAQNRYADTVSGVSGLFETQSSVSGESVTFTASMDGRAFVYLTAKVKSISVTLTRNNNIISENSYSSLEDQQIVDLGDAQEGDRFTITSTDSDAETVKCIPAMMSYDKLDQVMEVLEESQYEITTFEDTYVCGNITAESGQVMMTSIPCYSGWDVYVDGVKTEYESFRDAFIAVRLSAGEHTVEFRYHSSYFGAAIMISILAIAFFVMFSLYLYRKNNPLKKRKKKTSGPVTNPGPEAKKEKEIIPTVPVKLTPEQAAMNDELAQMSARLAKISGELAKMSEKPLEK